ncbi:MAG: BadF/BadG/BcrA/BcrD ATPase family protein [Bacteroidia bacterium]
MYEIRPGAVTLVADSGSTKTHWAVCSENDLQYIKGTGINPMLHDLAAISKALREDLDSIDSGQVSHIYFYGAGCSSPGRNQVVEKALLQQFPKAKTEVEHDLLAAARVLCEDKPGIVCILGTGSNSCHYDGHEIVEQHGGLGYILGDEGSGQHIGNKFLRRLLNKDLPATIISKFNTEFQMSKDEILQRVYGHSHPNRFIASFAPFIHHHRNESMVKDLIKEAFTEFIDVHLNKLNSTRHLSVHALGSVAYYFRELWEHLLAEAGYSPGNVIQEPIHRLVAYHQHR